MEIKATCQIIGHKNKELNLICLNAKCKNPGFLCNNCLKLHPSHPLISNDLLCEDLKKILEKYKENKEAFLSQTTTIIDSITKNLNQLKANLSEFHNKVVQDYIPKSFEKLANLNGQSNEELSKLYLFLQNLNIFSTYADGGNNINLDLVKHLFPEFDWFKVWIPFLKTLETQNKLFCSSRGKNFV